MRKNRKHNFLKAGLENRRRRGGWRYCSCWGWCWWRRALSTRAITATRSSRRSRKKTGHDITIKGAKVTVSLLPAPTVYIPDASSCAMSIADHPIPAITVEMIRLGVWRRRRFSRSARRFPASRCKIPVLEVTRAQDHRHPLGLAQCGFAQNALCRRRCADAVSRP